MNEYYIDECPICRQGILIIVKRRKKGDCLVMCDDCESQWVSPGQAINGDDPLFEEVEVTNATFEEIEAQGWWGYVKNPD